MNERIRELVRESNLDVYGLGKERYKWEYTVEKFAKLIVQDCADIAFAKITKDSEAVVVSNAILDSFGVER